MSSEKKFDMKTEDSEADALHARVFSRLLRKLYFDVLFCFSGIDFQFYLALFPQGQ